jgi:hypothetical protein
MFTKNVRMQVKKNGEIEFAPQMVLSGSIRGTSFYKRRIPEYSKIRVSSEEQNKKWIQKDLKYQITKWSVNKLYLPTPRSMEFESIVTITQEAAEQ